MNTRLGKANINWVTKYYARVLGTPCTWGYVDVRPVPSINYLVGRWSTLPLLRAVTVYAEYDDFRDWVVLESLEDLLRESKLSSYAQDEYVSILRDVTTLNYTVGTCNIRCGSFFVRRAFPSLSQVLLKTDKPLEFSRAVTYFTLSRVGVGPGEDSDLLKKVFSTWLPVRPMTPDSAPTFSPPRL